MKNQCSCCGSGTAVTNIPGQVLLKISGKNPGSLHPLLNTPPEPLNLLSVNLRCGLPKTHGYLYSGVSLSRVHSDPSLHMNAMGQGNANKNYTQPPVTPPPHRRIIEMVGENAGDNSLQINNYWDSKKMNTSRPKSCEVPNINIYPSQEHSGVNSTPPVIPMTTNNTGSLPDLSVLQFPSPLSTPLDQEDPYNNAAAAAGSSPVSLSPTSPRHIPMGLQSSTSPNQHRRQNAGMSIPSPLVLNHSGGPPSPAGMTDMDTSCMQQNYLLSLQQCLHQQQQLQHQQQQVQHPMRHRSAHSPHSQPYPSPLFSTHHRSLNHTRQATKPSLPNAPQHHHHNMSNSPTGSPTHTHQGHHQSPILTPTSQQLTSGSSPVPQVRVVNCDETQTAQQVSLTQYRNNGVSDSNCQSPTSPHSAPSYSPSHSPGVPPTTQTPNSTFSDSYYLQQQQQANALQHQFQQFNMDPMPANSTSMASQVMTSNGLGLESSNNSSNNVSIMAFSQQPGPLQYSQAAILGMTSSEDMYQPHFLGPIDVMASGQFNSQPTATSPTGSRQINQQSSNNSPTSGSKIPDIILTGADDMCRLPLDFAKELGNAITGMPDNFDTDFLTNDEAFKDGLDPLDFEGIQMLTDASLVADPATEDTFKLDRL
ncbi:CREB regulated transcription coactivator 1 [Elysia marginata]|uniref:CREB regulated transcription coactivator 1 n=1 Tax=Elysia marginata TaxID=1093978 RepID=A0AAV4G5V4_9GAST|nr:CREB regulated transcription coactivator 1 [Elysia marginata]